MLVNGINYKRLSFLTARYKKDPALIPQKPGMYFWIFFPDFDPKTISINDFRDLMIYYTNSQPFFLKKSKEDINTKVLYMRIALILFYKIHTRSKCNKY
jgi:hypothetical protein